MAVLARKLPAPLAPALATDILRLARCFAALAGQKALRIRLEGLVGPGCHRSLPNAAEAPARLVLCLDEPGRIPLE